MLVLRQVFLPDFAIDHDGSVDIYHDPIPIFIVQRSDVSAIPVSSAPIGFPLGVS
jgi:hypothetical protein